MNTTLTKVVSAAFSGLSAIYMAIGAEIAVPNHSFESIDIATSTNPTAAAGYVSEAPSFLG